MTFEVEVGERVRTVSVKRQGESLRIESDGQVRMVDARRVGDDSMSLLVGGDNGHAPFRSVDVALVVRSSEPGGFDVHVGGHVVPLTIRPAGAFGRHNRQGSGAGNGPQRITAPMPGKIARVLVNVGDEVAARQGLAVVEAMKMENELRASRPGRVREVTVVQGQSVEAGTVLVVVE